MDHKLVPPHTKLTQEEHDKIIKKYNLMDKSHLTEISRFDPVARIIGLKPDEICKIERPCATSIVVIIIVYVLINK